ncbi:hypothetical protein [Bremerella volcania]|uniref:hypothetical protein n=1 Tax=Bremerella volcania TaxID=2527984 RepID=UPI0011A24E8B|nr:hypothetical protein [Bremerella volcania]
MYAACLLITSAVLGVDFGYQPTDQGQLEYIIQIEPEALEKLKAGEAIQVGLPPNVQRVQVFRVQVGDAELPKILPTAYEEAVNERTNPIGLMPTESPKLSAPPETTSAADTKPALGDELAQYIPRQTRTLPSGATEPSPTSSTRSNTAATNGGTSYPPIPGAEERYGGATTSGSRFSVPATPGSPYSAVQTSGTTPLGSAASPTGSTSGNATSGSQYSGGTTNPGGTNWSATSQNSGTTANNTGTTNSASGTTNPYRFNQPAGGTNQSAPDLISPSDSNNWVSNNTGQSNTGQSNTGSAYGNNQTNPGTGQTGQTGGISPPNNNGSNYNYPGTNNGSQQPQNNTNPSGSNPNTENPWLTGAWNNNQTGGNTAPYSPMPNNNQPAQNNQQPQYNNQQPPAGYNPQQQPYGNNFVNNGYGQPPYNYNGNPNYPYNPQAPYYQGQYAGQQPVAQVAWNQPAGTAPPAQQQPQNTTTNASVSDAEKEKEVVEKIVEKEVETLPSWWPFLAFGFLLSFCANGYMFIISQDFRHKYQDLLEDVRDLRTMSND